MNEQIKLLADRLWRVHPSDIDAMGLKTRTEFYEHELKKFAELIVKECNKIMAKQYQGPIPQDVRHMMLVLQEHFGVEE
jgi:hypothetical protein